MRVMTRMLALAGAAVLLAPAAARAGYRGAQVEWVHVHGGALPGADDSEIVAYDKETQRIYVAGGSGVDVLDPSGAKLFGVGGTGPQGPGTPFFTTTVTSVAVSKGVMAVSGETRHFTPTADGQFTQEWYGAVRFYTTEGIFLREVRTSEADNNPDTVSFTPDGRRLLTAIEGETGEGAIGIIDVASGALTRLTFEAFEGQRAALEAQGVLLKGSQTLTEQFQPEFVAISRDGRRAFVTLQEQNAIAVVDLFTPGPVIERIFGAGFVDRGRRGSGFDPSDRDGVTRVRTYPHVFSSRESDQIVWFQQDGIRYVAAADEGDDGVLDADGFVPVTATNLDPTRFPDPATLLADANLGRIAKSGRDLDGDGDLDEIFTTGGRSVSIWREDGTLAWSSGDAIERALIARGRLDDSRSDNRGPEAEGVAVGQIGTSLYLFASLEKGAGVAVFDVTVPEKGKLVDVIFSDVPGEPLNEPEGLAFVPASASWDGKHHLVVSSEGSGRTFLFRVLAD